MNKEIIIPEGLSEACLTSLWFRQKLGVRAQLFVAGRWVYDADLSSI